MMNNEIKAKIDRLEAQELRFALVLHALAYLYSKVERTRPIMKKTTILFTIDDKYSPHWQITPEYDTEADAMVDFDRFVGPYHKIFAQSRGRDKTTHELWSKNKDEYWFWINSKPWPKIHVKMSKITVKE